ncbi:hypothetical protein HGRIS_005709 [Hohenbuehelia grisea]|uniref:3-beta hydroxysteroid dehydrogenase/isomerase domain-containing protein n=1 Tax=Hohenbuehelia grisea TaxID=104357 RepID=A0ABR3JYR2_9AGAR
MVNYGLLLAGTCGIVWYLRRLSLRLHGNHPAATPRNAPIPEELDNVSYSHINMLNGIPTKPTMRGYVVVGGSGYVGKYIVKLLLMRGETSVRIIDLDSPSEFTENPSVSFIRADVTDAQKIREAISKPFDSTGKAPEVIFYTVALIRFWERASYCFGASYNVNVLGMKNALDAVHDMSPPPLFIFTSSAETAIPSPRIGRLGLDWNSPPYNTVTISDYDPPLVDPYAPTTCYSRTKSMAEDLVRAANGKNGLKTAILRPGFSITGPNDRAITGTLLMKQTPVFDKLWSHTNVCVWDVAAAHLMCEEALETKPEEVAGEAFLISGNPPAWRMRDMRNAAKYYSKKPITLVEVSPLLIYFLAHFVEAFLFLRYHILRPLSWFLGFKPTLNPRWMGELVYLQPATLKYFTDVHIDDSRARKVLGYV